MRLFRRAIFTRVWKRSLRKKLRVRPWGHGVYTMNVYYQIHPFCGRKEHLSFIVNKREMNYWGKTLPSIVRYLVGLVRNADGSLGLVEDRGEEYWMTTTIPVMKGRLYR